MTKVAVVTGGTRGIGADITAALVKDGYKVAAFYFGNEEAAQACAKATGASIYKVDVTRYQDCMDACVQVEKDLGSIAVLVNNAGKTNDGMMHKMGAEAWDDVISTNLTSCFNMCRSVINGMRERGYGRIINISSVNGQKGQFGQTNYSAAKAGMLGLTKALAMESAAKGITVNAICPGYIRTEMTGKMKPEILEAIVKQIPVGRLGTPEEVAAAVVFLASDKASFITGSTLSANGGQYMS
ncbi:MAG: acetoacetyl-CoA reductase [Alphaproteobacteria bacterium]|nr:acetoacetyl-CoA reductase [Alphaproteobacteria bacterium]